MSIDGGTLAVIVMAATAGLAGNLARRPKAWRDAFESERARVAQLEKSNAELQSELTSARARPDMTRLAGMIDASTKTVQAEHERIILAMDGIADTLQLIHQELQERRRHTDP